MSKLLTNSQIKAAKPKAKPYKLSDAGRLYVLVGVNGSKRWKWNYRMEEMDSTLTLGSYPALGLAQARLKRDQARALVEEGIDPRQHQRQQRAENRRQSTTTFWGVCQDWIAHRQSAWTNYYAKQVESTMRRYIGETPIGERPIKKVTASDIYDLVTGVAKRNARNSWERRDAAPTLAIMLRQWCSAVFRFAIVSQRAETNPVAALKAGEMVTRPKVKNNRALNVEELTAVSATLREFGGQRSTSIAIELLMLTFVRTAELRHAEWSEVDLGSCTWTIPADKMKIKTAGDHLVPLSTRAVALLNELRALKKHEHHAGPQWLFRNTRRSEQCMSATTINRALERMGFNGPKTIGFSAHGFRGTASTLLHEMGYRPEVIEMQLAHKERNAVKAAYNKAKYIADRTTMMQQWADYIASLNSGSNVVTLKSAA